MKNKSRKLYEKNIRTYLLGGLAIIASWTIATWQELIKKFETTTSQLTFIFLFELSAFFLVLNLFINTEQIKGKLRFDNNSKMFIDLMSFFFFFLFLSFFPPSFFTQIGYFIVSVLFVIIMYFAMFSGSHKKFDLYFDKLSMIFILVIYILSFVIFLWTLIAKS